MNLYAFRQVVDK